MKHSISMTGDTAVIFQTDRYCLLVISSIWLPEYLASQLQISGYMNLILIKNLIECRREGRVQCEVLQKYYLYHYSHLQIVFLILKRSLMIAKTNFIFFHVGAEGLCCLLLVVMLECFIPWSNILQKQLQFLWLRMYHFLHKSQLLLTVLSSSDTCHVEFSILHSQAKSL